MSILKSLSKFWGKVKWGLKELILLYSSKKSFFSKKRIESGLAFVIAQWGMIFFLIKKIDSMDTYDIIMWASVEFLIAGYIISKIQNEKAKSSNDNDELG